MPPKAAVFSFIVFNDIIYALNKDYVCCSRDLHQRETVEEEALPSSVCLAEEHETNSEAADSKAERHVAHIIHLVELATE